MLKILVPVDGSSNDQHAVRHVLRQFRHSPGMQIHLLNVQAPFSRNVTRFAGRATVDAAHHEASKEALRASRRMLDEAGAPYTVHYAVGERATLIAEVARDLRCDHIVMGTARKSSLIRTFQDSVTNKVLELTTVPVVVIAGDPASRAERYGIPAGVGAGLALLVAAAAE